MTNNVSYGDLAYQILGDKYNSDSKNNGGKSVPMKFLDLLKEVGDRLGFTTEEEFLNLASKFYTALTLDGRFVSKENNIWVLREHEKYEDVHIDMNKIYTEDEDEDEDSEKELGDSEDEIEEAINRDSDEDKDIEAENEDDIPVNSGDMDDDENN